MTKTILDKIRYIDDITDEVVDSIEEVRSSVSYTLNSTTKNLTLNGSSDYEIKNINGEEYIVYGYPEKWNFDVIQGDAGLFTINGQNVFVRGDCGIVSCLNILYMSGYFQDPQNITFNNSDDGNERIIVQKVLDNGLCDTDLNDPEKNGATNCGQIVDILGLYGISAYYKTIYVSHNEIASSVKDLKGVIVSVNAQRLNSLDKIEDVGFSTQHGITNHFICVTGVAYDKSGNIVGFYIANSSKEFRLDGVNIDEEDLGCDFLSVNEFNWVRSIVGGSTIITEYPIKTWDSNINGTGNSLDNIIKGTSGNNVIKGEGGDDVLVGGEGKDEIYGGADDDVLIAGVAKKTNQSGEKEDLSNEELKGLINQKTNIVVENFESEKGIGSNLYGGEGNDLLIGDKGNDVLVAGEGEDYLYGGAGRDILCNYEESARLYGGYGKDRYNLGDGTTNIIRDTDNKGEVYIKEYWLRGAEAKYYLGNNVWIKDNIKYAWNEDAEKLFIQKQGESEITTIEDYHYGALSIKLDKPKVEEIYADGQLQDPLVLDMNGDGIKTSISAYQGIYYDYNNDGFAEKMAWGADGDGVLVVDANNDGVIQGSNEILTSLTLASYDTNLDGKIDYQDTNFQNLKIMDEDGNVFSLEEAGIASIDITNTEETNYTDENGNRCTKLGSYTTTDGEELRFCFNPIKEILLAA